MKRVMKLPRYLGQFWQSLAVLVLSAGHGNAQGQLMRHLELRGGLALDLPLAWQLRDSSSVRSLEDTAHGLMATMKLDTAVLSATLLVADGPGQAEALLSFGPAPGITSQYFGRLSPPQLEAYRKRFCDWISVAVQAQSRPAPTCGALVRDSVKQRDAVLIQYGLAEPEGDEHAFAIHVATSNAVVTLSLISRGDRLQDDTPIFRRIWRSLVVPDTLSGFPN
jgi:hypothetical protein